MVLPPVTAFKLIEQLLSMLGPQLLGLGSDPSTSRTSSSKASSSGSGSGSGSDSGSDQGLEAREVRDVLEAICLQPYNLPGSWLIPLQALVEQRQAEMELQELLLAMEVGRIRVDGRVVVWVRRAGAEAVVLVTSMVKFDAACAVGEIKNTGGA